MSGILKDLKKKKYIPGDQFIERSIDQETTNLFIGIAYKK